jgi:hypothetical protein
LFEESVLLLEGSVLLLERSVLLLEESVLLFEGSFLLLEESVLLFEGPSMHARLAWQHGFHRLTPLLSGSMADTRQRVVCEGRRRTSAPGAAAPVGTTRYTLATQIPENQHAPCWLADCWGPARRSERWRHRETPG